MDSIKKSMERGRADWLFAKRRHLRTHGETHWTSLSERDLAIALHKASTHGLAPDSYGCIEGLVTVYVVDKLAARHSFSLTGEDVLFLQTRGFKAPRSSWISLRWACEIARRVATKAIVTALARCARVRYNARVFLAALNEAGLKKMLWAVSRHERRSAGTAPLPAKTGPPVSTVPQWVSSYDPKKGREI